MGAVISGSAGTVGTARVVGTAGTPGQPVVAVPCGVSDGRVGTGSDVTARRVGGPTVETAAAERARVVGDAVAVSTGRDGGSDGGSDGAATRGGAPVGGGRAGGRARGTMTPPPSPSRGAVAVLGLVTADAAAVASRARAPPALARRVGVASDTTVDATVSGVTVTPADPGGLPRPGPSTTGETTAPTTAVADIGVPVTGFGLRGIPRPGVVPLGTGGVRPTVPAPRL